MVDFGFFFIDWMFETDGVSNNGFVDDDDLVFVFGLSVEIFLGLNGFIYCLLDVLCCFDGEMVIW